MYTIQVVRELDLEPLISLVHNYSKFFSGGGQSLEGVIVPSRIGFTGEKEGTRFVVVFDGSHMPAREEIAEVGRLMDDHPLTPTESCLVNYCLGENPDGTPHRPYMWLTVESLCLRMKNLLLADDNLLNSAVHLLEALESRALDVTQLLADDFEVLREFYAFVFTELFKDYAHLDAIAVTPGGEGEDN